MVFCTALEVFVLALAVLSELLFVVGVGLLLGFVGVAVLVSVGLFVGASWRGAGEGVGLVAGVDGAGPSGDAIFGQTLFGSVS